VVGEEQMMIVVRVQPSASQNELLRFKDGVLHVRIAASPTKGKANQELIKFLSDILGISKSNLVIEKGMTGKSKVIRIDESIQNQVMAQLERLGK
jgi:uncharacterized protein (TIGR00251 family)